MKHGILSIIGAILFLAVSSLADDNLRGMKIKAATEAGVADYDPARCHALVIGINTYEHWNSLRCAANDAHSIADVLKRNYGYGDVQLLTNEQATRKRILNALDGYLDLGAEDSLFIYYAGHGWMDPRSQSGYWVPTEAPRDDKTAYLSNTQITGEYFRKYKVKHMLVVSDSCFSGALLSRGGETSRQPDWKLPAGFQKPSRWVLTSGDLAPVPDDAGAGHSPFATRLLQFLQYADSSAYGIQDLYVYIRKYLNSNPICMPLDTPAHMPGGEYAFFRLEKPVGDPLPPLVEISTSQVPIRPQIPIRPQKPVKTSSVREMAADFGHGARMEFVWIEALKMWVGKYEVTNDEYRRFKPDHESQSYETHTFNKARQPALFVSYDDAVAFCEWMNRTARFPGGFKARLPDGNEWTTYARCGDDRQYPWGNEWPPKYGNYHDQVGAGTWWSKLEGYHDGHPVTCAVDESGKNDWGLYGVGGNAWEWTSDLKGVDRVIRGASWGSRTPVDLNYSAWRGGNVSSRGYDVGFRVVLGR